jgi:hypothetical protein
MDKWILIPFLLVLGGCAASQDTPATCPDLSCPSLECPEAGRCPDVICEGTVCPQCPVCPDCEGGARIVCPKEECQVILDDYYYYEIEVTCDSTGWCCESVYNRSTEDKVAMGCRKRWWK